MQRERTKQHMIVSVDCKLKVLGRVFCADGQYAPGERRKLRAEELHELCNPTLSIRVMILKGRDLHSLRNVRGKEKCVQNFMEKRKGNKLHDIKTGLKRTEKEAWSGFIWLRICLL
jgi:hypothetical protein